jgi:hypothetical protein
MRVAVRHGAHSRDVNYLGHYELLMDQDFSPGNC